jgi:hypothetical protein
MEYNAGSIATIGDTSGIDAAPAKTSASVDNAFALIVGIATYQNVTPLPSSVVKDAKDIAERLTNPSLGGYQTNQVQVLLNEAATKASISESLARLAANCTSSSIVTVFFSCHGATLESGNHMGAYLLPVDARFESAEALAATAISSATLSDMLKAIPAKRVLVVFDACHSAGLGTAASKSATDSRDVSAVAARSGMSEATYANLMSGRGRVVLASSRDTESSYVLPGATNSLFTQHLLGALDGGAASDDGFVRIFDVFEYLQPRVTSDQPLQHPVFKGELEDNFPIALYRGGTKGTIDKDDDGFRYDAYVSFVDRDPDAEWVNAVLIPALSKANIRFAVTGDVEQPGVPRLVGIERAIESCKRIITVLSPQYMADGIAGFESGLAYFAGVIEDQYRLLPLYFDDFNTRTLPLSLQMLTMLNLSDTSKFDQNLEKLTVSLRGPLPSGKQ